MAVETSTEKRSPAVVPNWRALASVAVALAMGTTACADEPESTPPALTASAATDSPTSSTAASATATDSDTDTDSGTSSATTSGDPIDRCAVGGAPPVTSTSGTSTGDAFKFDVGSPDGGIVLPISCDEAAEQRTNLGCEFFAVDLPNDPRGTFMSPGAADQQFAIAVGNPSALQAASIEVYLPEESMPFTAATIEPTEAHLFELPSESIEPEHSTANGRAYRVVSDVPVTAYQFNPLDNTVEVYSNDASLLFPVHALGQHYTAVTGDAVLLSLGDGDKMPVNAGAFVSIVGASASTNVEIELSTQTVGDVPTTVSLERGQVVTYVSSVMAGDGNLSGTQVHADAPVAVFAGNVATAEPLDAGRCCADHMEHQMLPHPAWGSRYVVAPPPSSAAAGLDDPALYRFVGLFDGTELAYCPEAPEGAPTTLNAGQTAEFATDRPFSVFAIDPKQAFSVVQFVQSNEVIADDTLGDPAMLVVPASAQHEERVVFVVPNGYAVNRATVFAPADAEARLDDELIGQAAWEDLGVLDGVPYRYAQVEVDAGQHFVEGTRPLGVSVFGYDEAVSFAYPGGAGVRIISIPPAAG